MPKIAILDDYANLSLRMADWGSLPEEYEPVVFTDNLVEHDALVERLKDFEIVCAMRERTPFSAALFQRLPNLKLFVTSGMRNNAVDFEAAGLRYPGLWHSDQRQYNQGTYLGYADGVGPAGCA